MTAFQFHDPLWLLLLAPLGLLVYRRLRRDKQATVVYSESELPHSLPVTFSLRVKRLLPWMAPLALLLAIVALARPQWGESEFRLRTEGIAIEMCLDRSGSMQARDFKLDGKPVNRLTAVKSVFKDFVLGDGELPGRPDDRIGLIAFAGYADSKCPLTLDHGVFEEVLKGVKLYERIFDSRGRWINERLQEDEQSTAIGDAIAAAVDRLKECDAKSRVIILLSDGESNAGVLEPLDAAKLAESLGIKVYTIGVGSTGMAPMPVRDRVTGRVVDQRLAPVRLDEDTLREIAAMTGGEYFNAHSTEALEEVYAKIDTLEKTEHDGRVYTRYAELYLWLLGPALALALLEQVLAATRFRSLP